MSQHDDIREVMELIAQGRTSNLQCPFCKQDKLKKGMGDYGPVYTCPSCKKFIEAALEE